MRTIAIAAGGDSSEFEISVKSAVAVSNSLSSDDTVYIIMIRGGDWYWEDSKGRYHSINKNDFSLIVDDSRIRFDAVFIAIHGSPGENGLLQGVITDQRAAVWIRISRPDHIRIDRFQPHLYLAEVVVQDQY